MAGASAGGSVNAMCHKPMSRPEECSRSGSTFLWGQRNYVRLDPFVEPAHILHVRRAAP